MEVVASLSQGRTAAAQCGLFTYKSVPVILEPPCSSSTAAATVKERGVVMTTLSIPKSMQRRWCLNEI